VSVLARYICSCICLSSRAQITSHRYCSKANLNGEEVGLAKWETYMVARNHAFCVLHLFLGFPRISSRGRNAWNVRFGSGY
jgi:hypothetical protein